MSEDPDIEAVLMSDAVVDELAEIEHERWAHWQSYMHEQCRKTSDGSLIIPADLVQRWSNQIDTPYAELSDSEKESDREQVRRYLPVVFRSLDRRSQR